MLFTSRPIPALVAAALGLTGALPAAGTTEADLVIESEGATCLLFRSEASGQPLWPYLTVTRKDTGAPLKFTSEKQGMACTVAGAATLTFSFRFDAIQDGLVEAVYAVPFSLLDLKAATEARCTYAARQVRSMDGKAAQLAGHLGALYADQESKAGEAFGGIPSHRFNNSALMYRGAAFAAGADAGAGAAAGTPTRRPALYRFAPGGTPDVQTEIKAGARKSPDKAGSDEDQVAGFDLAGSLPDKP